MPSPIYLADDIRTLEKAFADARPPLMERAGAAAAEVAAGLVGDAKDVLVLAGPGNNGGDARILAERLKEKFFRVTLASRVEDIPETRWGLVVDGIFGIGLARDISGGHAALVDYVNRQGCPVLALDIPSGLDADSGRVLGRAVRATHTVTFIGLKPGLLTLEGPDHCGEILVRDLGIEAPKAHTPSAWVAEPGLFREALKRRPRSFHKGMAGTLGVLGGASGMMGAALLAGRAAVKLGAGRVRVGFLADEYPGVDPYAAEMMLGHADDVLGMDLDAVVAGPGLGTSERAETVVGAVVASDMPCVLDADALNLLAEYPELVTACSRRKAETLITPHPGEAARLLGTKTADVQANRIRAAWELSSKFNAHVVLKGNGSVLVARDGHWFVNRSGNAGMASAGMGDVLAGMLGALLSQRYSGESAMVLGTHLHGIAGDELAASGAGPVGLAAGELIDVARRRWNAWLNGGA